MCMVQFFFFYKVLDIWSESVGWRYDSRQVRWAWITVIDKDMCYGRWVSKI
jgi:hypothetical protein